MRGKKLWIRFAWGVREGEKLQMLIRDQEEALGKVAQDFSYLYVCPFAIEYTEGLARNLNCKFDDEKYFIVLNSNERLFTYRSGIKKIRMSNFFIPITGQYKKEIHQKICDLFCIKKESSAYLEGNGYWFLILGIESVGKYDSLEIDVLVYDKFLKWIKRICREQRININVISDALYLKEKDWILYEETLEAKEINGKSSKVSLLAKYFGFYDESPTCFYWDYAAQNKMSLLEEQVVGVLRSFSSVRMGWRFLKKNGVKSCLGTPAERWNRLFQKALQVAEELENKRTRPVCCDELIALFPGVECGKKCNVTTPALKGNSKNYLQSFCKYFSKTSKESRTAQLLKVSSVLSVSLLKFADGKIGRLVSFYDFDGCIKECPLTIRDLHGKRFVEKLEESGLGIMNTPENVRLLRYKILNRPCDGTAFSVRKTGWNTVNDENVFVTAYGCYPTPSCKIIPQIPGGIVYPHTCLSKSHLPQLSFLRELPPSAQNILYFLFGVMASGPLLNSIPKSHAFFHVFGLSDDCATFWSEFMGMFSSVGNPLPASWYFFDFIKKKKSLSAYQDATVVFKPLGASEHRCYRNFVNKVCKSRRNFTCSSRKSVRIVRDPGPEDELRIAALSFGKEAVCGMSPQEKKLEYVGTKKDVYLENIKASKEMEEWFQENEKQCSEILRMWRPYRGLFYQQLVEKLFSDGKRKLLDGQYCPCTEALERRGKELVYMAQDLQAFKDIEIDLSIPRGVRGRGMMGETKFEDLEPCDEKWEKILKEVQEEVGKLHKGFKPHEIVHHKYFSFLMYKGTYCYFDRGEIFTKKFKKKNKLNPFVDYLKKQKILVPAKSRNSVSLWIPKTNIGKKDKPRYIGGRCLYGYAMSFKRLSEWGRKPVSKDFDACKALQGCKELDQKNSHSKKWEQALQSFLSSGNAQKI